MHRYRDPGQNCEFESAVLSLLKRKDDLQSEQLLLTADLQALTSAIKAQSLRKSELESREAQLRLLEQKVKIDVEEVTIKGEVIRDAFQRLQDYKNQVEALENQIGEQETTVGKEEAEVEVLTLELEDSQSLLSQKNARTLDSREKLQTLDRRVAGLETKKLDLMLKTKAVKAAWEVNFPALELTEKKLQELHFELTNFSQAKDSPESLFLTEREDCSIQEIEDEIKREEQRKEELETREKTERKRLEKAEEIRIETQGKKLELTKLVSKVQAKIALCTRSITEMSDLRTQLASQKQLQESSLLHRKERRSSAEVQKTTLMAKMQGVETECDELQSHLSDCLQRERNLVPHKEKIWTQLLTLKEKKSEQSTALQLLKEQKHAILIQEIQVEELELKVKSMIKDRNALKETHQTVGEMMDYEEEIKRLDTEDEMWQRQYRTEQMKLRLKAEMIKEKEAALHREMNVSPRGKPVL